MDEDDKINILNHGPIQQRDCTDFLWVFIFAGLLFGMGVSSIVAFKKGNPARITYPYLKKSTSRL